MRASRTWIVWSALAFCAVTILGAMAWQTRGAMESERDRIAAEERADLQERMRLALWRMDSAGAAIIDGEINGVLTAPVRARFEWLANGELIGQEGSRISPELKSVIASGNIPFGAMCSILKAGGEAWKTQAEMPREEFKEQNRDSEQVQKSASSNELRKRAQVVDQVYSKKKAPRDESAATPPSLPGVQMRPVWMGGELFLLKPILRPTLRISGSWIDLAALQKQLLHEARDLLPQARLVPAASPTDDGLVLASFPLRLEPGSRTGHQSGFSAPITLSLIAGWSAAVIAILAASLLVFGVMRLSERRASFVSAVTHELRTPLTTFRLYSDMLETGAVKPEKRGDYLRVLSREADRLSHLVENVLAFSRIERGSARSAIGTVRIADLLEPMRERLEARLATAGIALRITFENPGETLRLDATAIEHILFNLVDNAAKYAAASTPPLLDISTRRNGGKIEIQVSDRGPGIAISERRRIFRAFHKSAREAAETRPGVGLGLALSRRLARNLGGDLVCAPSPPSHGARFILSLPVSRAD